MDTAASEEGNLTDATVQSEVLTLPQGFHSKDFLPAQSRKAPVLIAKTKLWAEMCTIPFV